MLSLLTKPATPPTHLRASIKRLLETVLAEAGLPGPLRGIAQSYLSQASDAQLVAIVDTLEQVVAELRRSQALDQGGDREVVGDRQPAAGA